MADSNVIEIKYQKASFIRRVFANLVDILLFVLVFVCLFLATRAIVNATPDFKKVEQNLNALRLETGLYIETSKGEVKDIITYNLTMDLSASAMVYNSQKAINNFLEYAEENVSSEAYQSILKSYDDARLDEDLVDKNGNPYYIQSENGIIRNPDSKASDKSYFTNFYTPFIDEVLKGYLVTSVPNYYDYTKYMSNMLFYVELPISYLLAGIIVYFVPTLIFSRGKKTFGKALYRIGLVDSRLLSPTFARGLARFCLFYFCELILSLFTFGIPFIISFSMMAFSKKRQSFIDYMLNLREVDTTNDKIFHDYDEITLDGIRKDKKPVDFKLRDLP